MEVVLSQLKELRASLKRPIDAHRALISPMRHIPHDVLLEIFFSCLPSEHNALIDAAEAPLLLGRICRHWRSVAYNTPMLWSSMHIPCLNYLHTPPNIISSLERTVEAWLVRSATCPLSISLFDKVNYFGFDLEKHPLILQLLLVSRRLQHLTLAGAPQLLRPLMRLGPKDLPLLKSIWIEATSNPLFGDIDDRPNFTEALQIPTLNEISLYLFETLDPLSLPLKWSRLTVLCLRCFPLWAGQGMTGGLDVGGAFAVLRRCPNLVRSEMGLTRWSEYPGPAPNTSSIILPHLHTLVLSGYVSGCEKWISHLVVPNLRSLRVGDTPILKDIASNSVDNGYMSTDIDPINFDTSRLHELLQFFPMISHLRLYSATAYEGQAPTAPDDTFLASFCPPHNLCPMLTHLIVIEPWTTVFSDVAVLAFVQARMSMPTPLQEFRVHFNRPMDLDVMPELQSFISDGLQVTLDYATPRWKFGPREGLDELLY
ncbi:hypothetical protein DFH08DRAFT_840432 [Mycena albidolilacea]|uniref:F-box domain-containing protein n=1 Tax=Mycena albidolilacea TaxID=1033008 RepID=A0AAD7F4J6_9AGAR|nr:hypothetical protein DFH08DRAFT_840432 [Mycena albidolilacea]